jgi:glutathione synthase/RimK-type ligase-like ATP-grasp enzyme
MSKIALVTARAARALDEDLPPLEAALKDAGVHPEIVDWDDASAAWASYQCAIVRSTWDYSMRLAEFFEWAERAAAATTLLNPLPAIRWNMDKHYLGELAHANVPVVPTAFIEPNEDATKAITRFLREHDCEEIVVKPAVSSGSRDAQRHSRDALEDMVSHVRPLQSAGRSMLLQPYLERVDRQGETALIYFGGVFSHAIRKGPLLKRGESPVRALFAQEHITRREPTDDELQVGERALAAIPWAKLLYTRVDLLRDSGGRPCVLELELAEPSLFFSYAEGSAHRFAKALLERL